MSGKLFKILSTACLLAFTQQSFSQVDEAAQVQSGLDAYNQAFLKEKLYVHTDKSFYLAGEVLWFKIYNVTAGTNKPIYLSKLAYVEILDRASKPVLQSKIELGMNGGAGSFYLPLSLKSDQYTLRAYTSWMKNGGNGVFFEQAISIVNTMKQLGGTVQTDTNRVNTEFFPESGYLVTDVETKLAFRCTNQVGRGVMINGAVVSDLGDTVSRFTPAHAGIGSFIFKPQAGRQYTAVINSGNGNITTATMPAIYTSGYVMNLADNNDGRIKVRVQAKKANATERGEKVFLLVHAGQATKKVEYGFIAYDNDLVFYVDKSLLGEGVSHFTLFTGQQHPVAERLFFIRPKQQQGPQIAVSKNEFGKREAVGLKLNTSGPSDSASYSLAIIQDDGLLSLDKNNITNYLWLTSDLRGEVESPGYYLGDSPAAIAAADNLMLTHGWRRFRWENIFNANKSKLTLHSLPELTGHYIKARVTDQDGKPAPNVECYLSFPARPYGFYINKTDSKGEVYFDIKKYYGSGEIIIQADPYHDNKYRVDVQTPFTDEPVVNMPPALRITGELEKLLTQKNIAMQAQNLYQPDSIRRFSLPDIRDTFPFYGKPEFTYNLDVYKRFTTMEEVLREYVTSINVSMHNGKAAMSIWDEEYRNIYTDNLLVLLDGVPIRDYNKLFAYDPLKIKKLDVVPRRYLLGPMIFSGIASFETYRGVFDGFEMVPGIVAVDYEGLQLQREFYSPDYTVAPERKNRIPDLRSTLYWQPNIDIDEKGNTNLKFSTSDRTGKFLVVVQGVNKNGETVYATSSFEVK